MKVLLAILVDSYMAAKEEEEEKWKAMGYEELPSMLDQVTLYKPYTLKHSTPNRQHSTPLGGRGAERDRA